MHPTLTRWHLRHLRRRDYLSEIDRHASVLAYVASLIAVIVLVCYALGNL